MRAVDKVVQTMIGACQGARQQCHHPQALLWEEILQATAHDLRGGYYGGPAGVAEGRGCGWGTL